MPLSLHLIKKWRKLKFQRLWNIPLVIFVRVFSLKNLSTGVKDCKQALDQGVTTSQVIPLSVGQNQINAYCDMTTDGGGWTVFQRRKDGSVDFYRNWTEYENGFGDASGDFWLGNRWIHLLTSVGSYELRIDFNGGRYVKYSSFSVGDAASKYMLTVSGFSGNESQRDKLTYHNGMKFSTYDQDNDQLSGNCAVQYSGAWWYKTCYESNLNGIYGRSDFKGIQWTEHGSNHKTFTEMKFRQPPTWSSFDFIPMMSKLGSLHFLSFFFTQTLHCCCHDEHRHCIMLAKTLCQVCSTIFFYSCCFSDVVKTCSLATPSFLFVVETLLRSAISGGACTLSVCQPSSLGN